MRAEPLKVWITRAQPGAAATAGRVRALGHVALVAPLLAVEPEGLAEIDLAGVGALAFTSANGVRAFVGRSSGRALPVYAVGTATAEAARAAGFEEVAHFDGGVEDLAAGLAGQSIEGVVLHPGAAEPAGDLAGALAERGLVVRRLTLYRTRPVALGPGHLNALAVADVALVHSAKGAEALAKALRRHPQPRLKVLGISAAALRPLAQVPLAACAAASHPRESDLLALLVGQ
jgi:uroporphyrinogen-III synthase